MKIPGYSDYLHPYGDNYLIGFGKDTVEVPFKDYQGRVKGTTAYYLGMKVALFDITDVTKPKELFTEAVSYTHLDVYKRQTLVRVRYRWKSSISLAR